MVVKVNVNKISSENGVLGLATLSIGNAITVRNIAIRTTEKGGTFIAYPSIATKNVDEQGKQIYSPIFYPKKGCGEELNRAIMQAYTEGHPVYFGSDQEKMNMNVNVSLMENRSDSLRGMVTLTLNNQYVINSIQIRENKDGGLFVHCPSYESSRINEETGKKVWKSHIYPTKEAAKEFNQSILDVYHETKVGGKEAGLKKALTDKMQKVSVKMEDKAASVEKENPTKPTR